MWIWETKVPSFTVYLEVHSLGSRTTSHHHHVAAMCARVVEIAEVGSSQRIPISSIHVVVITTYRMYTNRRSPNPAIRESIDVSYRHDVEFSRPNKPTTEVSESNPSVASSARTIHKGKRLSNGRTCQAASVEPRQIGKPKKSAWQRQTIHAHNTNNTYHNGRQPLNATQHPSLSPGIPVCCSSV
jgi:hypothetical protein